MWRMRTISVPQPCPHLSEFRSRHGGPHPFLALQDCVRAGPMGRAFIRRGDVNFIPRCSSSLCSTRHRLYACVACAAVNCHSHAAAHSAAEGDGHDIAVDVDRAELFCCRCRDQVYDPDFDAAVLAAASADFLSPPPPPENLRKRRRVDYRPWEPGPTERHLIAQNATVLTTTPNSEVIPWGLRGLNNLGSSCFMNCVLQALLHTPPLRNYFLSDRHNRYFCQRRRNSITRRKNGSSSNNIGNSKENLKSSLCLACDLDALFSAVFSGERTPFSPAKLLYSWWQHAANLATYEQQDAHEFFISMLDGIHEKVEKDRTKMQSQGLYYHKWMVSSSGEKGSPLSWLLLVDLFKEAHTAF